MTMNPLYALGVLTPLLVGVGDDADPPPPPPAKGWAATPTAADMGKSADAWIRKHIGTADKIANPTHAASAFSLTPAPDGTPALLVTVPEGEHSGAIVRGTAGFDLGLEAARLSYRMWIADDVELFPDGPGGGKLTGLAFGPSLGRDTFLPTGGKPGIGSGGTIRLGWVGRSQHADQRKVLMAYAYWADHGQAGKEYGAEYRTRTVIPQGRWVEIHLDVRLNTVGKADGWLALYMDGVKVLEQGNLQMRLNPQSVLWGPYLTVYYGGSGVARSDSRFWFKDFRIEPLEQQP